MYMSREELYNVILSDVDDCNNYAGKVSCTNRRNGSVLSLSCTMYYIHLVLWTGMDCFMARIYSRWKLREKIMDLVMVP